MVTIKSNGGVSNTDKLLGYQGETNARILQILHPIITGCDYRLYFELADGTSYEISLVNGTYIVDGSLLANVGPVAVQWLAVKPSGDTYELVQKSEVWTMYVAESIDGDPIPIPTYEQAFDKLTELQSLMNNTHSGKSPYIGGSGNWYEYDDISGAWGDTGIKAEGIPGLNALINSFIDLKEYGAVGDGLIDDTDIIKSAITECQDSGKILLIPRGIFKFTETLFIEKDGFVITGTNARDSVLQFMPPESEEPPVAIRFKANSCTMSSFTLTTGKSKAERNVANEIGMIFHYDNPDSEWGDGIGYAYQHSLTQVLISSFDIGLNLYGGWNKVFTNCWFKECKTTAVNYFSLQSESHGDWSNSGDVYIGCEFIHCGYNNDISSTEIHGAGMILDHVFQMSLRNCVFEYDSRPFHAIGCQDLFLHNCWNEKNENNSIIEGSAYFQGGYNFNYQTVDHINSADADVLIFNHITSITAYNKGNLRYRMSGGYIDSGITAFTEYDNMIKNSGFSIDGVKSFNDWSNDGMNWAVYPDDTVLYDNLNSCKIDTGETGLNAAAWTTEYIPVESGKDYSIKVFTFINEENVPAAFTLTINYGTDPTWGTPINILPVTSGAWQEFNIPITIPMDQRDIKLFFGCPSGGKVWFAKPALFRDDHYLRSNAQLRITAQDNNYYVECKNLYGDFYGYLPLQDNTDNNIEPLAVRVTALETVIGTLNEQLENRLEGII